MKHIALLAVLFFATSAIADDAAPATSARQAAVSAEQSLADRGVKGVYIEAITLQRGAAFGGETFWLVKWSQPIFDSASNKREIGVKVRMDGSVVRLTKVLGHEVQGQGLVAGPTQQFH